jgi:hypothetical protein
MPLERARPQTISFGPLSNIGGHWAQEKRSADFEFCVPVALLRVLNLVIA